MVQVTEEICKEAVKKAKLHTRQAKLSMPAIQRFSDKLEAGNVPPVIHVHKDVIVDGNHRYVAGLIMNKAVPQREWAEQSNPPPIVPWSEVYFDPVDWGN